MATTAAPRWNRLEHDERRAQILACARRLFSERHYQAVSTEDIAREAGVARGLLHHYFGTKRELFLEVVRSMLRLPDALFVDDLGGRNREDLLGDNVDRWLEMVQRNRQTWRATVGAQGFGRDRELEAILEEARERIADRLIVLLGGGDPGSASRELRAVIRAYAGLAEAASLDWLAHHRLNRGQVRELLLRSMLALVEDVVPRVERARSDAASERAAHRNR
jgi:AcrR family transcriptional regulator